MGFRLIKERSAEYRASCQRLKKSELEKEIQRWGHLTTHSSEQTQDIYKRMQTILAEEHSDFDKSVRGIQDEITAKKINIAKVQGNLEIARLTDLILDTDVPKNARGSEPTELKELA